MRWLLLKDLRILRRSPFLVALLIAYPVAISVLIGLSLSRGPDKPKVAFVNLVPDDGTEFQVGDQSVNAADYAERLFDAIDPVPVDTREEALQKVRDGEVLGALIVPKDVVSRLQGLVGLGSADPPQLEVVYNAEDPIKARYVEQTIESQLAEANRALSGEVTKVAAKYLDILLRGGSFGILGRSFDVLGLQNTDRILRAVAATLPEGSSDRAALERVARFAGLAVTNLDIAKPLLQSVGEPIKVKQTVLRGDRVPLDAFAVAVAVTISLMFVCVLLASGMLALEREEHAFTRLVRGLVSPTGLVAEKVLLSGICGALVTVAMALGVAIFVDLDLGRLPFWLPAFALGALAFGAMGVALGAIAREIRVASLLAFLVALPIAFLALVPSGAVSAGLFDVIRVINALFPFKPALQAVDAAVNDADPGLGGPLLQLGAVTAAYGVLARVALRRLA